MLLPWLTLFDLRTVFSNFIESKKIDHRVKYDDFTILIPIFNDTKYLTNINFLKRYKEKVILCTTNLENEKFYKDLNKIAKENKFRIIKCEFKKESKNPWKIYQKTLLAHDYVLGKSIDMIDSKYVIFLDADTTCRTNLAYLAGIMDRDNTDIASVKVVPSKKNTITENLQDIEYRIAMKSRRIYPWLTSGAAMIAKRESMIKIMKKHSLFFNGGDIEIGKIAHLSGMNVDHIPVTFYTDVPETFPKLVKQRFSWFCGAFRHSVINAHTNLFSPLYSFYFTVIIFLMLPLKIYELFYHWYIIPFLIMFYMIVTLVTNWEIRSRYMLLFPFYSLFQIIVMPILGIYRYGKTVIQTKNHGFMKIHYKTGYPRSRYVFNIFLFIVMGLILFNIHLVEGQLLLSNIDLFGLVGLDFYSKSIPSIIYNGFKLVFILLGVFFFFMAFFKAKFHVRNGDFKSFIWS